MRRGDRVIPKKKATEILRLFEESGTAPPVPGVYFIQTAGPDGPVKIGVATDIRTRLAALQTAHPWELKVLGYEHIDDESSRYAREQFLHQRFAADRMSGEWFRASQALLRLAMAHQLEPATRADIEAGQTMAEAAFVATLDEDISEDDLIHAIDRRRREEAARAAFDPAIPLPIGKGARR